MENSAHPQSSGPALPGNYEPTDVNTKGVLIFLGILFAVIVFVQLTVNALSHHLAFQAVLIDKRILRREVVPSIAASRSYFPPPREQVSPQADLQTFRAQKEAELNSYGWINRKAGVVRIPIDRAMDLILRQGLPVAAGSNENQTGPSSLQLQQQRPLQFTPSGKEKKQ